MCTFSPFTPEITRERTPCGNGKGFRLAMSVRTIAARVVEAACASTNPPAAVASTPRRESDDSSDMSNLLRVSHPSKVRRLGFRQVPVEQHEVSLDADVLRQRVLRAVIADHGFPGLIERVLVLDREFDFELLAGLDHPPALDHVQLLGVRRAEMVDEGLGVQSDRI